MKKKINFENYKINNKNINPNEINNCLIRYWCIDIIEINNKKNTSNDLISHNIAKKIIKKKIISGIVSEMINEPLFDKIRTIDKLGYIVKADNKIIINNNSIYYIVLFLVQSSFSINKISDSIDDFNNFFSDNLDKNEENYLEKFRLLKESKLLEFSKPVSDLYEEVGIYLETITSKFFNFDLNKLFYDECKKINFKNDIYPILKLISMKKSKYSDIILEKIKKID